MHWNGAVDAIMNKLGAMINDIEMRRKLKAIDDRLKQLPKTTVESKMEGQ